MTAAASRLLLGIALLIGITSACSSDDGDAITIFAAASLTETVEQITTDYQLSHPDIDFELVFAGSNTLATQILEGGPADLFLSANEVAITDVIAAGVIDNARPFARNRLTVVVPADNPGSVSDLAGLTDSDLVVARCASEVPCGRLTDQVLDAAGVVVEPDTLEPNVRAALTRVQLGEVDAAFVYRTDALAAGDSVDDIGLPEGDDLSTLYIAGTVRGGHPGAADVLDHIVGQSSQITLQSLGFESP